MNRAERPAPKRVEPIYRRLSPLKQTENPPHLTDKHRRTEPRSLGPLGGFLALSVTLAYTSLAMAYDRNGRTKQRKESGNEKWIHAHDLLAVHERQVTAFQAIEDVRMGKESANDLTEPEFKPDHSKTNGRVRTKKII